MYQILLHSIEILTLLCGILGIVLSFFLICSLDITKTVSNFCNQTVILEEKLKPLDRTFTIESVFYKHHFIFGILFIICSYLFLFFLFCRLNIQKFVHCLTSNNSHLLLLEVFFNSMALFCKITGFLGILTGLLLLIAPNLMKKLESKISYWFFTQTFEEKLNEMHKDTDTICFIHPILIGSVGLITSSFLTILSIFNLLRS